MDSKLLVRWLLLILLCASSASAQTIYWSGGEDIDFPNGPNSACSMTNSGYSTNRPGYGRGVVNACSAGYVRSLSFTAQTSVWIHAQSTGDSDQALGLGKSGTGYSVLFAVDLNGVAYLGTWDGTTWTTLEQTASGTIPSGGATTQLDMQISSYGASCVLNLYMNAASSPLLTYSGNCTVGGNTSLDTVFLRYTGGGYYAEGYSEIIVASSDTRALSLVTLAPNANGTTQSWATPAYTNINPISINDSNFTSDNNNGDVTQYKMNCLPSGTFSIKDVRIVTRGTEVSGGLTHINSGFYNGSSDQLGTAAAQTTSFFPFINDFTTNPFTSSGWQQSDIGCSSSSTTLQLELKSGT